MNRFARITTVGVVAGLLTWSLTAALAQKKDEKDKKEAKPPERPSCVVMEDDPINFRVSVMTDDGPVYFCCKHCIKKYEADPKKYAKRAEAQRAALAKMPRTQVTCPLSGEAINKKAFVEEKGGKVYFCCDKCPAKYQKEPAKYKSKLLASYSYQTTCPVMGEPINPKSSFKTPGGETVYFCCNDCIPKFQKDHEKYAKKLAEQGLKISMTKPDAKSGDGEHDDE